MRHYALCLGLLGLLTGCGDDATPSAPVDHIQRQINTGQDMKRELQETAKAKADEANKLMDQRLKSGQPGK
jgi:hypothetical protein